MESYPGQDEYHPGCGVRYLWKTYALTGRNHLILDGMSTVVGGTFALVT